MRRLAFAVVLGIAAVAGAQLALQPRYGAAASQSNTGTLPTLSPLPASSACQTCSPPNFGGQSSTVTGALNLTGCQSYSVSVYPGAGCALLDAGTEQVTYWTVAAPASVAAWARNQPLDEQNSQQPSGGATAWHFPSHPASGIGWIQVTPNGVAQDGGCTTLTTLIEGALCGS